MRCVPESLDQRSPGGWKARNAKDPFMPKPSTVSWDSPGLFRGVGVNPPRGALLHGPPGCGKTTLLRAAAYECGCNVEVLNGGDVAAKKPGEAEEVLRAKFAAAEKGGAPASFFFDRRHAWMTTHRDAEPSCGPQTLIFESRHARAPRDPRARRRPPLTSFPPQPRRP